MKTANIVNIVSKSYRKRKSMFAKINCCLSRVVVSVVAIAIIVTVLNWIGLL